MNRPILLVEDNDNDIFFMRRALRLARVTNPLLVIEDGREALEFFAGEGRFTNHDELSRPSILLLDLNLPKVSGLELLEYLRSHSGWSELVVVVLTSSESDRIIETAYRLGANSYLVKPPTPDKLREMVEGIRQQWLSQNRPVEELIQFASQNT